MITPPRALGSVIGRYILTLYMPQASGKISGVLFIDWRQLLGHKKLRLNFQIWKH
jgi:hypothetical protein